jgi:prolyl-tRNA synthetase
MGLTFLDESGKQRPVIMGCYGLGVSRIVAAVVEQNHDENGIIWPATIAPFTIVVIPATSSHKARAEQVYDELTGAGIDAIFDDRDVSFGVKVKDADLIGYPYQAIIGNRANDGRIEVKDRRHGEGQLLHVKEFPGYRSILNC